MDTYNLNIIKTEYAGKPKGYMKSKTESETVNGNGAERRKRTHMACYVMRIAVTFYAFVITYLLTLPIGNFYG